MKKKKVVLKAKKKAPRKKPAQPYGNHKKPIVKQKTDPDTDYERSAWEFGLDYWSTDRG